MIPDDGSVEPMMDVFVGVDVGGTFTDFSIAIPAQGREILHKVPSTPAAPDAAIVAGLAEALARHDIPANAVVRLAHGTTVGTNALIQRKLGKVALVTTEGFRDLLEIGRQTRPKVYDIHRDNPKVLVPRHLRFEVGERMRADGTVHRPLDRERVRKVARLLLREKVDCVAVCFLHAHSFPQHEREAASILAELLPASVAVITSSSVYPEFREYERCSTTVLNAALLTVMNAYLDRFTKAVRALGVPAEPTVSQSAGGLMSVAMARRFPIRSALSGPAAGAIGAARRAMSAGHERVVTLDVGGTSADVCLLTGGWPALVHSRTLAGFPLRLPALDVNSVGAGGGSIAWIDRDGLLKVGPHSAGAVPGPACYDRGGTEATVTDANVLLGRLSGEALLEGRMPIRRDLAERAVAGLARRLKLDPIETAFGIVSLVCATMVRALRSISVERGHDPGQFSLLAFGGGGPLHATDVARELGIRRIIVPPNPGILCAEGLLDSDLATDFVEARLLRFESAALRALNAVIRSMRKQVDTWFRREKIAAQARHVAWSADLRYAGQNFELAVPLAGGPLDAAAIEAVRAAFDRAHERAYGFAQADETVEFVSLRAKLRATLPKPMPTKLAARPPGTPCGTRRVAFARNSWADAPIHRRADLAPGQALIGPTIIEQMDSTTPVFPGDVCTVDAWGNLIIERSRKA
jgi:N-methylhydantoinase A